MPSSIVTYAHRYKRPPRKRSKAAAIVTPAIVTAKRPDKRKHAAEVSDAALEEAATVDHPSGTATSVAPTRSAIVTIRRKSGRFGDAPDMTPEEHKRRGDAADALFREMKHQIAKKLREGK